MHLPNLLLPALALALSACNDFPELDYVEDNEAQRADYVDLVPVETLTAGIPEEQITPETEKDLDARIRGLKNRSSRLKGTVVDNATLDRMNEGIKPVTP